MFAWLLPGCSLKRFMPEGPAVDATARADFEEVVPAATTYRSEAPVPYPVLPVMGWGLTYDLDLVVMPNSERWDMHELARLQLPDGPLWLMKDARKPELEQLLVAELDGIERFVPEIPVRRKNAPVEVVDASTDDLLDLTFAYENHDGVRVDLHYVGKPPTSARGKRNGSTMGHSKGSLMAVLDLDHMDFAKKVELSYGGERQRLKRILGFPLTMAITQTQGGLAISELRQEPILGGFRTVHHTLSGADIGQDWALELNGEDLVARQRHPLRELIYRFRVRTLEDDTDAYELYEVEVRQQGQEHVTTRVRFRPALPDLRRLPTPTAHAFVVDIDGQPGHAIGTMRWTGERLELRPTDPWWVRDRPMDTTVTFEGENAEVSIVRVDP